MPSPPNNTPLGMYYGDQGGPGSTTPASENQKDCPFLDPEEHAFCTLDGTVCPFVGFNYRRCKKYITNMAKGAMQTGLMGSGPAPKGNNPPRMESLTEAAKKRGPIRELVQLTEAKRADVNKVIADIEARRNREDLDDPELAALAGFNLPDPGDWDADDPITPPKPPKKSGKPKATPKAKADPKPKASSKPKAAAKPKAAPKKASGKRAPKTPANPDIAAHEVTVGRTSSAKMTPKMRTIAQIFKDAVESEPNIKVNPTREQIAKLRKAVASAVGQVEYADNKALRKARLADANVMASNAHQEFGFSSEAARKISADIATILHLEAGGSIRDNPDRDAEALAHKQAQHDGVMGAFINDPYPDKPTGVPLKPPKAKAAPKVVEPNIPDPTEPDHPTPPPADHGTAEVPPTPPGASGGGAPPRRFSFRNASDRSKFRRLRRETQERTPMVGDDKTYAQESTTYMNYEQFNEYLDSFVKPLAEKDKKLVFAGFAHEGKSGSDAVEAYRAEARKLADKKAFRSIAELKKGLEARVSNIRDLRFKEVAWKEAWDSNLMKVRNLPMQDKQAYKMVTRELQQGQVPSKMANFMNKINDKLYTIEIQNLKIGDQQVQTFLRKANMPIFGRSDYEVMRMSQQMGLAAMQKQHQYGRGYGKWNAWVMFFRSVLVPFLLLFTDHKEYIRPFINWFPQDLFDQVYTAFINKPLPKLKGGPQTTSFVMAKDAKFLASQKMSHPKQQDRLMQGFDADMALPPDRAVLHTRWYPTTKMPWTKMRHKELLARHKATQVKALPSVSKKSFLRR